MRIVQTQLFGRPLAQFIGLLVELYIPNNDTETALIVATAGTGKLLSTATRELVVAGSEAAEVGIAAARSGRMVGRELAGAGTALETSASGVTGIARNVGKGRDAISVGGRTRIPDLALFGPEGAIALRGSIIEVKNIRYLHSTQQLRDLVEYARQNGLTLEIVLDPNKTTQISKAIRELEEEGILRIVFATR